jgi:hypothetical protein
VFTPVWGSEFTTKAATLKWGSGVRRIGAQHFYTGLWPSLPARMVHEVTKLELELTQTHITQKPMLRVEVGAVS